MWNIETFWFDIAIVMSISAIGDICLGHFEEHKPKWRRLLKVAIAVAVVLGLASIELRWVAYSLIGLIGIGALYIHVIWLPKHGINGWTGEPKEKYYELLGVKEPESSVIETVVDETKAR